MNSWFTPGDDLHAVVLDAIHRAQQRVLLMSFRMPNLSISKGLYLASLRGCDVRVVLDPGPAGVHPDRGRGAHPATFNEGVGAHQGHHCG